MKLEDKKIGLELAKKLSENGCDIESEYYWIDGYLMPFSINNCKIKYPAYDLIYDICVEHAEEFFRTEKKDNWIVKILNFIQQDKKEEAEKYLWDNCKFNPQNK